MGVKIRQKGGKWYVFIHHRGQRKAKCIGDSKKAAEVVKTQLEARLFMANYHGRKASQRAQAKSALPVATDPKRFAIFKRDNYRCRICGVRADDHPSVRLEIDHIIPRSAGGLDDEDNLWTLCCGCNRGKGAQAL